MTLAPAEADSSVVLNESPLPWFDVLMQSVLGDGVHDADAAAPVVLLAVGLAPVAPTLEGPALPPVFSANAPPKACHQPSAPGRGSQRIPRCARVA